MKNWKVSHSNVSNLWMMESTDDETIIEELTSNNEENYITIPKLPKTKKIHLITYERMSVGRWTALRTHVESVSNWWADITLLARRGVFLWTWLLLRHADWAWMVCYGEQVSLFQTKESVSIDRCFRRFPLLPINHISFCMEPSKVNLKQFNNDIINKLSVNIYIIDVVI